MAMLLGGGVAWSIPTSDLLTVVATVPVGAGPMTPLVDEATARVFVPNAYDGTVTVIDAAARVAVATIAVSGVEGEELRAAVLDSARSRIFVLTDGNRVVTVDTASAAVVRRETVPDEAQDLALDPARGLVYVLGSMPGRLTTLGSPSGRAIRSVRLSREPDVLAVNPRSGRVFLDDRRGAAGSIAAVDPRTGTPAWAVRPARVVVGFVFDASGRRAYVPLAADDGGGSMLVVDTRARRIIARLEVGAPPLLPVLDPSHRRAYVSDGSGSVVVLDTGSLAVTGQIATGGRPGQPALDGPRNRLFVPLDSPTGGSVAVYDTGSGGLVATVAVARQPGPPAIDSTGASAYVVSAAARTVSIVSVGS
jgi:YVTN family beta-propeller protein